MKNEPEAKSISRVKFSVIARADYIRLVVSIIFKV